jgi:hypothetical protein
MRIVTALDCSWPRVGAFLAALAFTCLTGQPATADDARVLLWGDPRVEAAEETFILAGRDPPLLERPVLEGKLREALLALPADVEAGRIARELEPPDGLLFAAASLDLTGGWNGSPERDLPIPTQKYNKASLPFIPGGKDFLPVDTAKAYFDTPPLLDLRFLLIQGPLVLDLNPELRPASNWYREGNPYFLNAGILSNPARIDVNIPYRGIATLLAGPFELRFGRDKLHFGPGRFQTLSFNASIPWADYAAASADFGPISVSWHLLRLNPTTTGAERDYIDALNAGTVPDPDTSYAYSPIPNENAKSLAIGRLTWRITPWATIALTQHDLVGGRGIQLSDFNPLILFHDLYQDGVYDVPAMIEASVVPLPGLRLYGQYLLYDAVVGDESDTSNAGASAYQAGLSAVMRPFAPESSLSWARLRLDAEFTFADPWAYGKYLSQRQFTSRFILVEPGYGRFWVDYPIGPSFGPDGWELDGRLAAGRPEGPEVALLASFREKGSIDLLGYGDDSDYADQSGYIRSGLVLVKPGEVSERRLRVGLEGLTGLGAAFGANFSLRANASVVWVDGYGNVRGEHRVWFDGSIGVTASFGK